MWGGRCAVCGLWLRADGRQSARLSCACSEPGYGTLIAASRPGNSSCFSHKILAWPKTSPNSLDSPGWDGAGESPGSVLAQATCSFTAGGYPRKTLQVSLKIAHGTTVVDTVHTTRYYSHMYDCKRLVMKFRCHEEKKKKRDQYLRLET